MKKKIESKDPPRTKKESEKRIKVDALNESGHATAEQLTNSFLGQGVRDAASSKSDDASLLIQQVLQRLSQSQSTSLQDSEKRESLLSKVQQFVQAHGNSCSELKDCLQSALNIVQLKSPKSSISSSPEAHFPKNVERITREQEALKKEISTLKEENKRLLDRSKQTESLREGEKKQIKEDAITEYRENIATAREKEAKKQREIGKIRQEVEETMTAKFSRNEKKLKDNLANVTNEYHALAKEQESLSKELEESKSMYDQVHAKFLHSQELQRNLEAQNSGLLKKASDGSKKSSSLKSVIDALKIQQQTDSETINSLTAEKTKMKNGLASMRNEFEKCENNVSKLKLEIVSHERENADLIKGMKAGDDTESLLQTKIEDLTKKLEESETESAVLRKSLQEAKKTAEEEARKRGEISLLLAERANNEKLESKVIDLI